MSSKLNESLKLLLYSVVFVFFYHMPERAFNIKGPAEEAILLLRWYVREHVLLCLVPAFFIAGAIAVFISKASVIKYFGAKANKILAYSVAAVSGSIMAVCSCTVLPLFSGIYKRGAGLGPATAFLYSGPAINVLAIIMTARVLGPELGIARAIGAVVFSVVIGFLMHLIFRKEEKSRHEAGALGIDLGEVTKPLWKTGLYIGSMIGILVFVNWAPPAEADAAVWGNIYSVRMIITGILSISLGLMLTFWFTSKERAEWVYASWRFAKQILPLLFIGVAASGILLGRPGHEGLIPSGIIAGSVGGNSLSANFFASVMGSLMYFATLTEIPILQGLIGSGMGRGPSLALLLAGPALSLPNMLVIKGVIGAKKTLVYVLLVVFMATFSGLIFGKFL